MKTTVRASALVVCKEDAPWESAGSMIAEAEVVSPSDPLSEQPVKEIKAIRKPQSVTAFRLGLVRIHFSQLLLGLLGPRGLGPIRHYISKEDLRSLKVFARPELDE